MNNTHKETYPFYMDCLNGFLHSISKRQWLCALSRLQCSQERDAIESNRQVVIVSWWSVLIKSSIYTICRLWKHIKASRWAVSREGELNEDWVKREHTIYKGGHKPAYTIRILFFQQILQCRCLRSIKGIPLQRLREKVYWSH